jgi:hypothetical protein
LCVWRRFKSAYLVRLAFEIEREAHAQEPRYDRVRLAWWVVRRAYRVWMWWPLHEHATIAQREAKRARKPLDEYVEYDPVGERAMRDVARIAADRWALAALEEFTAVESTNAALEGRSTAQAHP